MMIRIRTRSILAPGLHPLTSEGILTDLYYGYEDEVDSLHDYVQPPICYMISKFFRAQLGPIDQEYEPDSTVENRILGSYDTSACCHIYGYRVSPMHFKTRDTPTGEEVAKYGSEPKSYDKPVVYDKA